MKWSQIVTGSNHLNMLRVCQKHSLNKGLYMLATILKSSQATETILAIIETFSKVGEIERTIKAIPQTAQNSPKYQALMQKTGDLISDLVVPEDLDSSETEASIEVNLALVKIKYTVKKKGTHVCIAET